MAAKRTALAALANDGGLHATRFRTCRFRGRIGEMSAAKWRYGTTIAPCTAEIARHGARRKPPIPLADRKRETNFGKGKVHHAKLGNNIFGDRFDRRGSGLWWSCRDGKLDRADPVFRVHCAIHHQPDRTAGPAASCLARLGSIRSITKKSPAEYLLCRALFTRCESGPVNSNVRKRKFMHQESAARRAKRH